METSDYEFSVDWFSYHQDVWEQIFRRFLPAAKKILEIGSYEGRSSVWLADKVLKAGGELYCLDIWRGGRDPQKWPEVEGRFDRNVAKAQRNSSAKIHKMKGLSAESLVRLLAEGHGQSFDFVYVDGGHDAATVLTDVVLGYELCRVDGIICCDDYAPTAENPLLAPRIAIDSFIHCFSGRVAVMQYIPLYQVFLHKRGH